MNNNCKTKLIASVVLAVATAAVLIASARFDDTNSPVKVARNYYETRQEFVNGEIEIDETEAISSWNDLPINFAVVRVFLRRIGNGSPDRGQHKLLIVHIDGGVIGEISGFAAVPDAAHRRGILRINKLAPITLETSKDAYRLASTAHAGRWASQSNLVKYGKMAANKTLETYVQNGRVALDGKHTSEVLGENFATKKIYSCGDFARSEIEIAEKLPDQIVAFEIDEPLMSSATDPQLVMSKAWETEITATITDSNGEEHRVVILVVGDMCDRDRIAQVVFW